MKPTLSLLPALVAAVLVSPSALAAGGPEPSLRADWREAVERPLRAAAGIGQIRTLGSDSLSLYHEPIPAMGWPAMVMRFLLADQSLAEDLKPGDRVVFVVREASYLGQYEIIELRREG